MVLCTTNGSRALAAAAASAARTLARALVNVTAVAEYLAARPADRLAVVCAGTEGGFALDDALCAGALLDRLQALGPAASGWDDTAKAALLLFRAARGRIAEVLGQSAAATKLRAKGLEGDVAWAAGTDRCPVVPLWRDGALRPAVGPR